MARMTLGRALLAGSAVIAIATAVVWVQRQSLANQALERMFADRGVPARYTVRDVGLRWQRIENVSIGDRRDPDLTADWAEVRMAADWRGVRVAAIRAGGVRVKARFDGKRLTLGALDRLLPAQPAGRAIALPDLDLLVRDARMRVETPFGQLGARLDGAGNLVNGFRGSLAVVAPAIAMSGCRAVQSTAFLALAIRNRRPHGVGPLRAAAIRCQGVDVAGASVAIDATLDPAFQSVRGSANVAAQGLRRADALLARLTGRVEFEGPFARLRGSMQAAAAVGRAGAVRVTGLSATGKFAGLAGEGQLRAERVAAGRPFAARLVQASRGAAGTPIGPLAVQLARAFDDAGNGATVSAEATYADGVLTVARGEARTPGGAVLTVGGGSGIRASTGGTSADTSVALRGGGFPGLSATFNRRPDGSTRALARLDRYAVPGASFAATAIRFATNAKGRMLLETDIRLSGPIGTGRIENLRMPVSALIGPGATVSINRGCTSVAFDGLAAYSVTLAPTALRLCPRAGGALLSVARGRFAGGGSIARLQLAGRVGATPLRVSALQAQVDLADAGFSVSDLAVRFGAPGRVSQLDMARLDGRMQSATPAGQFAGLSGALAGVPLTIGEGSGVWNVRNGAVEATGAVTVADAQELPRFQPLLGKQLALRIDGSKIGVTGTLSHPETATPVTDVTIAHDLQRGTGSAVLDVPALRFGKALQPEQLTRLTLGVVANVEGTVRGRGEIAWTPQGVTSTGRFRTDDGLNFAAAFGPVTGLRGEILFDDLLALATPPGQQVTIASINPGIPVLGGTIAYRLLPGQKLAVEGGRWPFSGGELILEPSVLDLGQPVERRLTFRVKGLDAAKFVHQLEFDNLAATGQFDGTLPMIFDDTGGRIAGGKLVARAEGGTIAYVGEVSNAAMPVFGKIAFDALKSIRYRNLAIALDGPLDGEIVSLVSFNGVNQSPVGPPRGLLARQLIGLPFRFNIAIRAPFRGLLSTARTFTDPSLLIRRVEPLPTQLPGQPLVQPPASVPNP
ncbi:MAG: YdbH domain-containing protein [Sphingomonadaceae bacterium]